MTAQTVAWVDASAGVAGDMFLGALVDCGADLDAVQAAVDAVVPGSVRLRRETVSRKELRATKLHVDVLVDDPPHRGWGTIRELLAGADVEEGVRASALAVFARLAAAEARVHGIAEEDVHFHEVGALDSIADVVGSCAALELLGVQRVVVSPIATGSGRVPAAHGELPVPVPAVLELARGWEVLAGGAGELATPTGVALLTALGAASGPMPALRLRATGTGAGTRDRTDRANVVRVVLGTAGTDDPTPETVALLETNVDDLDPRVWPEVLAALMDAGALDAWLTPILMKKGRPAHLLSVLADRDRGADLTRLMTAQTSTLGVRRTQVDRDVLDRAWQPVDVLGGSVRVKVGHRGGEVVQAMPEFADVVELARQAGRPVLDVLSAAQTATVTAGLVPGAGWPRPPSS